MNIRHQLRSALTSLAIIAAIAGCNEQGYEIASVEGVVLVNGKPGDKLRVEFTPDGDKATSGPVSWGETDEDGRFTLKFLERGTTRSQSGTVVGWHRVVLTDRRLSASATGRDVPFRLRHEYTTLGSTPLSQEVKPGSQHIEIVVP